MTKQNHERRKARQKQTAEVFTPDKLVAQMLNKLPKEVWRKGKTFCDPAVGNGQFLVHVLIRKIAKGHKPLDALGTVYGVDIMRDNIQECRARLLKVCALFGDDIAEAHVRTVFRNIVWVDPKRFPGGSLEYSFTFANQASKADVDRWLTWIHERNLLDTVDLPVAEEKFLPAGQRDLFAELGD